MRLSPVLGAIMALGLLAACNEEEAPAEEASVECTQELVTQKAGEVQAKIAELASSDPEKMQELLPRIQEISTAAAAAGEGDISGSCAALDEIMAEMAE
jgi:hypothetical protein